MDRRFEFQLRWLVGGEKMNLKNILGRFGQRVALGGYSTFDNDCQKFPVVV